MLPLGCAAAPKKVNAIFLKHRNVRFRAASRPSGSKLPRHKDLMHRQKVDDITNGKSVMVEKLTRFDAATYLNTYEEMVTYLVACFEEDAGDGILIRAALNDVAQAKGMMQATPNEDIEQSSTN